MSYEAMRAVMDARDTGAIDGGPTLLVGLVLASGAARRSGEATASARRLAARCGLSNTTTGRAVQELTAAGVVEPSNRGGRAATRYRFALPTRDAKPVDNGPPALPERDTSEDLALPERDTTPDVALPERNANVPSVASETVTEPRAIEIPARPHAAKEQQQPPTGVVVAVPVQNLGHNAEVSAAAAAQARYAAELTDPADIPARVAELRAAADAEPDPPTPPEDDELPEGVVPPEAVDGYVAGVRARMRPRA